MDNFKPIKRPKPSDGEEDLYKMQDEFLKSHQEPSAKVINLRSDYKQNQHSNIIKDDNKPPVKLKSKFAERRALLKSQEKLSTSQIGGSPINSNVITDDLSNIKPCELLQDNIQDIPKEPPLIILGNIIEKKITKINETNFLKSQEINDNGFPSVFVIDHNNDKLSKNDKSLFSKSLVPSEKSSEINKISKTTVKQESSVTTLSDNSLLSDISNENEQKLQNMTNEEIIEEKKKLEAMLSPEMINFLKARNNLKKLPQKNEENIKMEIEETNKDSIEKIKDDTVTVTPNEVVEIVEQANEKGWIHMDEVEQIKLEWMNDLPENKSSNPTPEEPYNARFDFDGMLLPFKDDNVAVNLGLHHHGDEPDRPGYSLQELLQLVRSSSQQQRCTAITTLGNIMDKSKKGLYDKVLEPAPLVALNSKNIFYLLRITIDDSSIAVITAGLQALRSLLYNQADEICLDKLFGWKYDDGLYNVPELLPPKNDVDNYDELKDDEFVQLDVVGAAIRSDIILRIRFILSELKPPLVGVTAALEILTRLARHSHNTALNIACTKNLLDIIVKNFIPLTINCDDITNAYGIPQINAVRFCRVLVEYAGRPVVDRLINLKIINCLLSYITNGSSGTGLQLSIEAMRLWKLIINYGIENDSINGARLILGTQLQLLLTNHNIEGSSEYTCEYAGLLVSLSYNEETLIPIINTLLNKWTTQLENIKLPNWCNTKLIAILLITFNNKLSLSYFKTNWLLNDKLYSTILTSSNLLCNINQAIDRNTTALPSLGAFMQNGELQPILTIKSTILFLSTVINIFYKLSMFNELKIIIENSYIIKYLNKLSKNEWKMTNNWYTRIELYLLSGIIKSSTKIKLNKSLNDIILNISIKLVSNLPSDATNIIKEIINIIFKNEKLNIQKLTNELNDLKLNNNNNNMTKYILQLPDNISNIYNKYVSFGNWNTTGMPKDWPYIPLVSIYSCQKNKLNWNDNDTMNIIILLNLELSMPELFNNLSPNLRFSRLILIYLCETIYLNENVSILLNQVMKLFLINNYNYLDFSIDIPGISSFTDIFTSMCECFCANSYGDDGFSTVLLLPIAQKHDSHYRKLLWSEHAGSLRYIKIKPDNLIIPLNEYLYPLENDSSLIETYLTALVRKTVKKNINPLMYLIAIHHSANYINSQNKIAIKMKSRIKNIDDKNLIDELLNYSI